MQERLIAFKYSAGSAAGTMPAYNDGTTPTLVTEKPPAIAVRTAQTGANGCGVSEEVAHTVDTTGPEAVVFKIRGGSETYMKHDGSIGTAGKGLLTSNELAFTIAATQDQTLCAPSYGIQDDPTPKFGEEIASTLRRGGDGGTHQHVATSEYVVRRLTPKECERLQGMPDDHTKVPYRGKPAEECPDGPRYKAIGNSMAVTVMRWIGEQLQAVDEILNNDSE